MKTAAACLCLSACLAGCGSQRPNCGGGAPILAVSPVTATADHSAAPPGNQQQFRATSAPAEEPGCATPQIIQLLTPAWTVSDPQHVKISSANDSTNGLATCLGPTAGPVLVAAKIGGGSGVTTLTASLTCK